MISSGTGAIVEHCVPGRVRFRFPKQHRHPDVLDEAASVLSGMDGVIDVLSNPGTGSLLVLNDPDVLDEDGLLELARNARIVQDIEQELEEEFACPEVLPVAQSVMQGFKRFDTLVCRWTNGFMDGKMLIISLMLGTALSRALLGRKQAPAPWYALMWYGYSAFMHWSKPGGNR